MAMVDSRQISAEELARIALEQDIPVIPAAHWGTQLVLPRYGKRISLFPRKTIRIVFGDPVDLSAFRGRGLDSATLTEATAVVMRDITRLLAWQFSKPVLIASLFGSGVAWLVSEPGGWEADSERVLRCSPVCRSST